MSIFDRYLLRLFVKVLVVGLVSLTGMYIVIDAFANLDEFLGYGRRQGSLGAVLFDYYSARVPWFFEQSGAMLTLIAAVVAISWLQRSNELTAVLAAGVPTRRIVQPLLAAALVMTGLGVLNRELWIPAVRDRLARNAQDWLGDQSRHVDPAMDNRSGILLDAASAVARERKLERPSFALHRRLGDFGSQLNAATAVYHPPTPERPGGYLLRGVSKPARLPHIGSVWEDDRPLLLSPADTAGLAADECFVVSDVEFEHLVGGSAWRQFASTADLMRGLRNPSLDFGLRTRVTLHARFTKPLLDLTLFCLGLPLVFSLRQRNVFAAAGRCLGVVVGFSLLVAVCQALGESGYLLSPVAAVWSPVLLTAPLAAAVSPSIWD